jgi:O-antigen ligase
MAQQRFSFLSPRSLDLSPLVMSAILIPCLLLSLGQAILTLLNPVFGLISAITINLIVLLFAQFELALPFYIIVAGPSIVLSSSGSGILSRLYIGDLLFALIVVIWLLRKIPSERRNEFVTRYKSIVIPLICLALIGFLSIIYSRLSPDPYVTYEYAHSDVSLLLVNIVEMFLLIGLSLFIVIVPAVVRTLQDARLMIRAYLGVGLLYALGTIFAGPLHLYSNGVILGVQRPEIFGTTSSGLGILNVLFTCLALGQMLYARQEGKRLGFGLLTCIFASGVVLSFGREAWIALLVAIWVILFLRFKSPLALLLPLIILPLLLLFFPGIMDFFNPTQVYGIDRINIWQDAINIWLHSPLMGVGAGNFQFFDLAYGTDIVGVAHNQFLSVLAEMGVQGLACFLLVIIMIGRVALERFNTAISDTGKAIALAYLGYFAALLIATFFTDSFVASTAAGGGTGPFISMSYPWLFLGLVLSIPNWDREAATSDMPVIRSGHVIR